MDCNKVLTGLSIILALSLLVSIIYSRGLFEPYRNLISDEILKGHLSKSFLVEDPGEN
jgi:hypothetical protein